MAAIDLVNEKLDTCSEVQTRLTILIAFLRKVRKELDPQGEETLIDTFTPDQIARIQTIYNTMINDLKTAASSL